MGACPEQIEWVIDSGAPMVVLEEGLWTLKTEIRWVAL